MKSMRGMKKKSMKRVINVVLIMLFCVLAVACEKSEKGFYLTYNGVDIILDTVYDVNVYGKYNDLFESSNCAFGDRDVTYIYDDIEIETYGNKNNELIIYAIRFTNENVKTNEKIGLYDSINDAIEIYGNDFIKEDNKYTYKHGQTSLVFVTDNDIIESIEYQLNSIE